LAQGTTVGPLAACPADAVPGPRAKRGVRAGAHMVKRALCVGCNYPAKAFGLAGAVNDAFLIAECLQRHCGFEPQDVTVLHDAQPGEARTAKEVEPASRPTRANILQRLQRLVRSARAGDVVFFSFSGYGLLVDDGDSYADDGYDEAVLPSDPEGQGIEEVIVTGDLHDILTGVPAHCAATVLMDCDHATSVVDVAGTLDGHVVGGLKPSSSLGFGFCSVRSLTTKMHYATHDRQVWQEERARAAKARPRFQPLLEMECARRGRLPTRPAMSRSTSVAFCLSASAYAQTALELQLEAVGGAARQHGALSWSFARALEELGCECTYVQLLEAVQGQMRRIREAHLPRMDQQVLLTFSTPLSNPAKMAVLQPLEVPPGAAPGGAARGRTSPVAATPARVVPPPPPGFLGGKVAAGLTPGTSPSGQQRTWPFSVPPPPPRHFEARAAQGRGVGSVAAEAPPTLATPGPAPAGRAAEAAAWREATLAARAAPVLVVAGASGDSGNTVNGRYRLREDQGDGAPPAFCKSGPGLEERWIFLSSKGKWWIGPAEAKERRTGSGWAQSAPVEPGTLPMAVGAWRVASSGAWEGQPLRVAAATDQDFSN